jgi:hypothetical protein
MASCQGANAPVAEIWVSHFSICGVIVVTVNAAFSAVSVVAVLTKGDLTVVFGLITPEKYNAAAMPAITSNAIMSLGIMDLDRLLFIPNDRQSVNRANIKGLLAKCL